MQQYDRLLPLPVQEWISARKQLSKLRWSVALLPHKPLSLYYNFCNNAVGLG